MKDGRTVRLDLERERALVEGRVAALTRELEEIVESAQLANVDDEHDPDGSTIAYERAKVTALLAAAHRDLDDLDRALRRTDDDTYGRCLTCGRPIGAERLEALPAVTTCIDCARAHPHPG